MTLPPNPAPYLEIDVTKPRSEVTWEQTRAVWGPTTLFASDHQAPVWP